MVMSRRERRETPNTVEIPRTQPTEWELKILRTQRDQFRDEADEWKRKFRERHERLAAALGANPQETTFTSLCKEVQRLVAERKIENE